MTCSRYDGTFQWTKTLSPLALLLEELKATLRRDLPYGYAQFSKVCVQILPEFRLALRPRVSQFQRSTEFLFPGIVRVEQLGEFPDQWLPALIGRFVKLLQATRISADWSHHR